MPYIISMIRVVLCLQVFGALATARALNKPLLYSYHTHVPA